MPKGIQQKIVTRMAQTRWLGTCGGGVWAASDARLPPQALQNFAPSSLLPPQVGQYIVLVPVHCDARELAMSHRIIHGVGFWVSVNNSPCVLGDGLGDGVVVAGELDGLVGELGGDCRERFTVVAGLEIGELQTVCGGYDDDAFLG